MRYGFFSDREVGWLAGVVDGEGSISFHANKYGPGRFTVDIYNTNLKFLREFKRIVGHKGDIYAPRRKKTTGWGRQVVFELCLTHSAEIVFLLSQIQDSLIIKKELAKKAIALMKTKKRYFTKNFARCFTPPPQKTVPVVNQQPKLF